MAIVRVNTTKGAADTTTGGPNSLSLLAFAVTAGNLIVVVTRDAASVPASVTDTAGNTYTLLASDSSHDPTMSVWIAVNVTGHASDVITLNLPGVGSFTWGYAVQYSGLDASSPGDVSGARAGGAGSTDLTTNAFSTAQASEVVVVGVSQNNLTSYSAGADFTLLDGAIGTGSGPYGGVEEYATSGTLSSYMAHITSSVTNQYTTVWASFKAAGGGGATAHPWWLYAPPGGGF